MTDKEQMLKDLNNALDEHREALKAWGKVTRKRTKSGDDFKILSKNFENAKVIDSEYSLKPEKLVKVYYKVGAKCCAEEICNSELAQYTKIPNVDASRIIKETCLSPYFYLTVDEIFDKIENQKSYHEESIKAIEIELEKFDENFEKVNEAIKNLNEVLENVGSSHSGDRSNSYYLFRDYISTRF